MYDTITFKESITLKQHSEIKTTLTSLNKVSSRKYHNTGITATQATYRDCFFSLTENYLTVTVSLPKFLYGTNQFNFTRIEAGEALLELQDIIGINIMNAKVSRIDVAQNILVDQPVETYFKILCSKDKMKRWMISHESLYFTTKGKGMELNFYNKTAQLRDTGQIIQSENLNKHVMRYELRLKTKLARRLKRVSVTCGDLVDADFYNGLLNLWHREYQSIVKLTYAPATNYGENLTEFKDYLMTAGIEKLGASAVYDIVDSHTAFKLAPKLKYNIRKMLKALITRQKYSVAADAVIELDQKMQNILHLAA